MFEDGHYWIHEHVKETQFQIIFSKIVVDLGCIETMDHIHYGELTYYNVTVTTCYHDCDAGLFTFSSYRNP